VRERLSRQPLLDDAIAFGEARPRLVHVDVVGVVLHLGRAAADAEMQRAVRHAVQHGDLLGEPQRVVPRQHQHRGAKRQVGKGRRDVRHEEQRAGRRVIVAEMMFQQPGRVVAQLLPERAVLHDLAIQRLVGLVHVACRRCLKTEGNVTHPRPRTDSR
jgi:hypothetical protein